MRKLIYLLLIIAFLISCEERKKESLTKELTEITLILKGYNSSKNKHFIDFTIVNPLNPIKTQLNILDNGYINYTFINKKKKEVNFNYENRTFSLIVSPNEKVEVELNISEFLNWSKFKKVKVTGVNKTTNNLILKNTFYLDSLIKKSTNASIQDSTLNNILYKKRRFLEMKNHLQIFKNYVSDNKIKDKAFTNWAKAQITYKAGNDLSLYPFLGKKIKNLDDESDYFNYIKEVGFNSNSKITYNIYLKYLDNLTTNYAIISNISDKYKEKRKELKEKWPTTYFLKLEIIKKLPEGKDRDIMMAYLFKNEIRLSNYTGKKIPENYIDTLNFYSKPNYISALFYKKNKIEKKITTLIKEFDLNKKEKDELLKLYEDTKNKVIFNDFWFTNCAPCMKELPNYNNFISSIEDKNVVFIFYGVLMEKEEWKKTIDNLKLKGKHHLLTKNQLAFFEKYFGIVGYPHKQLIQVNGKIGKKVNFSVYPKNFKIIEEQIKKHNIGDKNGV